LAEEGSVFSVYPNPTTGSLTIKGTVTGVFTIYTIDGKQVAQYSVNSATTSLSLQSNLAAGIYMCRFTGDDGSTQTVRLIYEP
jgi:hypothetical protein